VSSSFALVTVGPDVGEETDPRSALSATDYITLELFRVADEVARGHDTGAELSCSVLSLSTLCCCVFEMASSK